MNGLLTAEELSNYANVKKQTVFNYRDKGVISATKENGQYFFKKSSIVELLMNSSSKLRDCSKNSSVAILVYKDEADLKWGTHQLEAKFKHKTLITDMNEFAESIIEEVTELNDEQIKEKVAEEINDLVSKKIKECNEERNKKLDEYSNKQLARAKSRLNIEFLKLKSIGMTDDEAKEKASIIYEKSLEEEFRRFDNMITAQLNSKIKNYKESFKSDNPDEFSPAYKRVYDKILMKDGGINLINVIKERIENGYVLIHEVKLSDSPLDDISKLIQEIVSQVSTRKDIYVIGEDKVSDECRAVIEGFRSVNVIK